MNCRGRLVSGLVICLAAGCTGCQSAGGETTEAGRQPPPVAEAGLELERQTEAAVTDLGARLGVNAGDIEILEAREVTWPDAAAGCPRPGMVYMQVLTPGVLVQLRAEGREYRYHARGRSLPLLCPADQAMEPLPGRADR